MSENCHDCKHKTELLNLSHDTISKIAARAEAAEAQVRDLKYKLECEESVNQDYLQVSKQRDDAHRLLDDIKKTALPFLELMRQGWDGAHYQKMLGPLETVLGLGGNLSGRSCRCSCHGIQGPNACGCCYYPVGGGPTS